MTESARLTRGGKLRDATAAIQTALRGLTQPAPSPQAHTPAGAGAIDPPAQVPTRATPPLTGGQFIAGSHAETAGKRDYKLYLPPAAQADAPLPLIVMLHGCTQDPDDFALGTGMNELARAGGCFVLYPAQSRMANPGGCWNWFKPNHQQRGRGEPALLAGMTREIMAKYPIDPKRVFVAGLSAGGAMAAILGQAYPDLYAAVGVHSGLRSGAASDMGSAFSAMSAGAAPAAASGTKPAQTPPTIVFHGDADSTVNPANGEQVLAASAGGAAASTEQGRGPGHDYTRRTYRDAGGRVRAEHWAVHGAGHAWSGGNDRGTYTDALGPDASAEMLRFFLAHPLS
jgi:poly(hydroxyalkanoate) depolymerase family esterase